MNMNGWTDSQEAAINDIQQFLANKVQTVWCLSGSPGTGKSYVISKAIAPLARNAGYHFLVTATTNKAAALVSGTTVHKAFGITLKNDYYTGETTYCTDKIKDIHNTLCVIDEASMLEINLWQIIQKHAHNCKFLLVGDMYQLPAVKAGADVFNKYPVSMLTEVVRQTDPDFLQEIENAKQGVLNKDMYTPKACGAVKVVTIEDKDKIKELLKGFGNQDKVLTYTNAAAIAYASNIRSLQGKKEDFEVGDSVISRNYCESPYSGTSLYCEQELEIASLSNVKSTEIIPGLNLQVREVSFREAPGTFLYAVNPEEYKNALKKTASLKNWKAYFFLKEKILDMRNYEACTIHCSQGSTYDRTFIDMQDIRKCKAHSVKARLLYVALSRAKNEVYIYDHV